MFKQAKNLKEGDVVIDRGRRFTVKRIVVNPDTRMIDIIDTNDERHGPYHPEEYLGVIARAAIRLSTIRFAELLKNAQAWDRRYADLCHAQESWLLENFVFGDNYCISATLEARRRWNVPRAVDGKLYTVCQ
jgi:hypothetical protein